MWVYAVWVYYAQRPQEGARSPGAGVHTVVSHLTWVLGSRLRSSAGAARALTAEPHLRTPILLFSFDWMPCKATDIPIHNIRFHSVFHNYWPYAYSWKISIISIMTQSWNVSVLRKRKIYWVQARWLSRYLHQAWQPSFNPRIQRRESAPANCPACHGCAHTHTHRHTSK